MDCPKCLSKSEVTHTDKRSDCVIRDRRCKSCGNKYNTIEKFHVKQKSRQRLQSKDRPLRVQRAAEKDREYADEFYVIDDMEEVRDVLREMGVEYGR